MRTVEVGSRSSRLLTPVAVPPAHQHVAVRIRTAIALGEYLPGERLPAERALAQALRVSRVTIRDALKLLQAEGLVESRRGASGGAVVLDPSAQPDVRRQQLLDMASPMRAIHEFREAVEPQAAALAAARRSEAQLKAIRSANDELNSSTSAAEFRQSDSAFHVLVAASSGNALLEDAVEQARSQMFSSYDAQGFEVLKDSSYRGHLAIAHAIERQDAKAARNAMRAHLRSAWHEISLELGQAAAPAVTPG